MPQFQGSKNIILMADGADTPHVTSEYDVESGKYVVTLSDDDAEKYGDALAGEGLIRVDEKVDEESGDDDA